MRVDEYGLRKSEYENLLGVKFDTNLISVAKLVRKFMP